MDFITTREAAKKWGISARRVQVLCALGKIDGTARLGQVWAIPANAPKPGDGRLKKNKSAKGKRPADGK